jgi:hypothetical protein
MISSYGIHRGVKLYVMSTKKRESVFFCDYNGTRIYALIWWDLINSLNILMGQYMEQTK